MIGSENRGSPLFFTINLGAWKETHKIIVVFFTPILKYGNVLYLVSPAIRFAHLRHRDHGEAYLFALRCPLFFVTAYRRRVSS